MELSIGTKVRIAQWDNMANNPNNFIEETTGDINFGKHSNYVFSTLMKDCCGVIATIVYFYDKNDFSLEFDDKKLQDKFEYCGWSIDMIEEVV